MREKFGDWGTGLSDAEFACALAALGFVNPDARRSWRTTSLVKEILGHVEPTRELPWRFNPKGLRIRAQLLARSWHQIHAFVGSRIFWIEVDPESLKDRGVDPNWVKAELSRPEVGATFVTIREPRMTRDTLSYSVKEHDRDSAFRDNYESRPYESRRWIDVEEDRPPRWLQARLRSGSQDVETLRGKGLHEAVIRIGQSDARWVSVEQPFPTPEEPPEPEGHWLTVIFWEPRVSRDPQVQGLLLPPEGNTGEIAFPFEVPAGLERIAARITVLHANRVLQTGLLRAAIREESPWTFTLDATPRTRLEGLSARSQFDVALVLNHDDEGTAQGTAISANRAVPINLGEASVDVLTRALGDQISKIAANPKRYENLQSEGTEELLRTLAQHGGGLYQHLAGCDPFAELEKADAEGRQARLHLTSARSDSFFPVELVYRYEVPEDTARLCEHALTALAKGSCTASCPSDKSETVCPLGFWGLCRVVERHSHLGHHEKPSNGFSLQPEPVLSQSLLDVSGKALLAASDAASKHEAGAVESLLLKLRQRGPAELASSWQEWSERVKTDRPTLLVLLPHHERRDGFEILEIGAADALKSVLVKKKHVRTEDDDRPIVLLMGCDTNLARIAFNNFVASFMLQGAAIVVSTIATILGRHASPATAHLIELLDEEAREGGSSFGEVMMRLRRKLLATETPMALGLTAYGDADWILTRKD